MNHRTVNVAKSIAVAIIVLIGTFAVQDARATTPYVDLTRTTQTTLNVSMSLAGFDFTGNIQGSATPGPGGAIGPANWGIGPSGGQYPGGYFYSSNGVGGFGVPGFVSESAVFWLEPGSSLSDLPDARFAVFLVADGHNFTTPFYSDVPLNYFVNGVQTLDDIVNGSCYGGTQGNVVLCPILDSGQSIDIPLGIVVDLEGDVDYTSLHLSFTDAALVPEPGAWAVMLVGLGLAGGAIRSRSRRGSEGLAAS